MEFACLDRFCYFCVLNSNFKTFLSKEVSYNKMGFERLKSICSDYSFLKLFQQCFQLEQLFPLQYFLSIDRVLMAIKTQHTRYNTFPSLTMFSHPLNIPVHSQGSCKPQGHFPLLLIPDAFMSSKSSQHLLLFAALLLTFKFHVCI